MNIEAKVDELIFLVKQADLDKDEVNALHRKISSAFNHEESPLEKIEAFKKLDIEKGNREDLVDDLEVLLSLHQLDSKTSRKYLSQERIKKISVLLIGVIVLTLGFAMIIMPAPPYFEMFTIFYFNPNDGITLMDLIALIIVFTGVYLILISILKKAPN